MLTTGKAHAIGFAGRRIDARGSGGDDVRHVDVEVHQRVGGQDVVFVGVDRLAGADDRIPIARHRIVGGVFSECVAGARKEMRDQDGVRLVGVQRSRRLPADLDVLDVLTSNRRVARQLEGLLLDDEVTGLGHRRARRHRHEQSDERCANLACHERAPCFDAIGPAAIRGLSRQTRSRHAHAINPRAHTRSGVDERPERACTSNGRMPSCSARPTALA